MTYQIEDRFRYEGEEYTLAACSAGEPFNPGRLGIETDWAETDCWRNMKSSFCTSTAAAPGTTSNFGRMFPTAPKFALDYLNTSAKHRHHVSARARTFESVRGIDCRMSGG